MFISLHPFHYECEQRDGSFKTNGYAPIPCRRKGYTGLSLSLGNDVRVARVGDGEDTNTVKALRNKERPRRVSFPSIDIQSSSTIRTEMREIPSKLTGSTFRRQFRARRWCQCSGGHRSWTTWRSTQSRTCEEGGSYPR